MFDLNLYHAGGGDFEEEEKEEKKDYYYEEEEEEEDEDVDPMFLDLQPRLIRLKPRGDEWRERIDALVSKV